MAQLPATPKQKEIFQLMNQGKGFVSPLTAGSSAISGSIAGVAGHASSLTSALSNPTYGTIVAGAGITTALIANLTSSAAKGAASVTQLTDYGKKATEEFSQRMRVADSYTNISKRFTDVDPACSAHSGVFGVVKNIGQTAMDTYHTVMTGLESAMTALNNAISKGLSTVAALAAAAVAKINAAIAAATAFANKIVQAIEDEVAELARQLAASTHAWLASALPDWFGDQCKGELTTQVSTPELKAAATA